MKNQNTKNNQPKKTFGFNFLLYSNIALVITVICLFFVVLNPKPVFDKDRILRDLSPLYKLTNPILDCEEVNQGGGSVLSTDKVSKEVELIKNQFGLNGISLYYRDLNNGPWIGVNEKETFSPASLLKTPIVMALYKYAETNPGILNKEILITEADIKTDLNQNIKFDNLLKSNTKYTFEKIVESVLKKSDNAGVGAIIENIPTEYLDNVFNSIGVPYKDTKTEVNLTVKDYAAFFRVLFNSSYLSRDMSEKLLSVLSQSEYKNGLVAGVPEGTLVAHKFGERAFEDVRQLHDCGIVYYPKNPYLICIMTRGHDFPKQENAIKNLSSYIYQEIDKNKDKLE